MNIIKLCLLSMGFLLEATMLQAGYYPSPQAITVSLTYTQSRAALIPINPDTGKPAFKPGTPYYTTYIQDGVLYSDGPNYLYEDQYGSYDKKGKYSMNYVSAGNKYTFKVGNKEILQDLVTEGIIENINGYSIVWGLTDDLSKCYAYATSSNGEKIDLSNYFVGFESRDISIILDNFGSGVPVSLVLGGGSINPVTWNYKTIADENNVWISRSGSASYEGVVQNAYFNGYAVGTSTEYTWLDRDRNLHCVTIPGAIKIDRINGQFSDADTGGTAGGGIGGSISLSAAKPIVIP